MKITVQKLTPAVADQFFYFFDEVAFTDNEHWASCYCHYYRRRWEEGEWDQRTADDNRRDCKKWIDSQGLNGYLAFLDDQPVGWCHANDKSNIALGFLPDDLSSPNPAGRTAAIICFIVSPQHRRQGIATKILQVACEELRREGYVYLEAYPNRDGKNEQENYHGHPQMYKENGFEHKYQLEKMDVLRKTL